MADMPKRERERPGPDELLIRSDGTIGRAKRPGLDQLHLPDGAPLAAKLGAWLLRRKAAGSSGSGVSGHGSGWAASWFDGGWGGVGSGWWGRYGRSWRWGESSSAARKVNYAAAVGSGLSSSSVMSPIKWVQRTFPEAPSRVLERVDAEEDPENRPDHPLVRLLRRPNGHHTEAALWQAAIYSWIVDGNAYFVKRRNTEVGSGMRWFEDPVGEVRELWWVPHWRLRPCAPSSGDSYISHYELLVRNRGRIEVPVENVIHFRNGIDPERTMYGLSVIYSELREIYTDDEAASFTASLLRNVGVPGMVVAPKMWPSMDGDDMPSIGDADEIKHYIEDRFGGENRGSALVMEAPADVTMLGYSPQQMDLSSLRNVVEERICAAIGIPASVVGFGTGLQQTRVGATQAEQMRMAWTGCILPLQRAFAEQLMVSLLPEFEEDPERWVIDFDRSKIAALQADESALYQRLDRAVRGGWLRVDHAQRAAGLTVDESQAVYLRGSGMVAVPAETEPMPPQPATPPTPPVPPGRRANDDDGDDDDDGAKAERVHLHDPESVEVKHSHSPLETRLAAAAVHVEPTDEQRALVAAIEAAQPGQEAAFEADLLVALETWGDGIEAAVTEVLGAGTDAGPGKRAPEAVQVKADGDPEPNEADRVTGEKILLLSPSATVRQHLEEIAADNYAKIHTATVESIENTIGLVIEQRDELSRRVMQAGGRRMGLVDLDVAAKRKLFETLAEARLEGHGPDWIARRIRDHIPAGPWSSSAVRARVIARTETLHAQRVSQLESYAASGAVKRVMVFDDRIGHNDEVCSALNETVVSLEDAHGLMQAEHPNGTRSFVPHISSRDLDPGAGADGVIDVDVG